MKILIPATVCKKDNKGRDYVPVERATLKEIGAKVAHSLTTVNAGNQMGADNSTVVIVNDDGRWRIRRLTPRECGRLMGVDDSDIDKMERANPSYRLYHQFGNSIVVDVLAALFRKLNIQGAEK